MAYIERFRVRGLAGRDVTVERELDRHVNIFWGLNGTGKTSLLKILHSALRNDASVLEDVPFDSAEVVFWSTDHEARLKRTFSNAQEDDDTEYEEEYVLELQADGSMAEVRYEPEEATWATEVLEGSVSGGREAVSFRHAYLPISRMSQVARAQRGAPVRSQVVDDAFLDRQFASQVQSRWQFYNGEANTRIRLIQQQGLASILAHLFGGAIGTKKTNVQPMGPKEAYALVSSFLRQQRISLRFGEAEFTRRYEAESDLQLVVANIQAVTEEMREALRPQEEFQSVIANLYSGGKELSFDTRHYVQGTLAVVAPNGHQIPLRSLSSGEKQLLRLMLEALAAEASTVMIDEPELSMHVDWQQVLVASMRTVNPDCQLLLATHSPEIMADVSEELVFEL